MYGFDFTGHPGLRHLYLPGEFEGFPLRKDFPLLARLVKPWPGLVDVEPMPGEEADAEGDRQPGRRGLGEGDGCPPTSPTASARPTSPPKPPTPASTSSSRPRA